MPEHALELQVVSRRRDGWRRYDENVTRALAEAVLRPGMYELRKRLGSAGFRFERKGFMM